MPQQIYDEKFYEKIHSYFRQRLPEKIYDAHFHAKFKHLDDGECVSTDYDKCLEFTKETLGRAVDSGLFTVMPAECHTEETIDKENEKVIEIAKRDGYSVGLLVRPNDGREKTEKMLDAHPIITALKPYLLYVTEKDRYEADITDFAPEWMWELANDRELPIIVHISHYQDLLSDENNIKEIKYITSKYPKAKMVLAHCAMGHNIPKLVWGLEEIKGIDNIWFDCSGITNPASICYCIKAFGVDKMMYGSDYDFGKVIGRIVSVGSNFLGLHNGYVNEEKLFPDYKYQPLNNAEEGLLALFQAIDILGLSEEDVQKIFYTNAKKLYK